MTVKEFEEFRRMGMKCERVWALILRLGRIQDDLAACIGANRNLDIAIDAAITALETTTDAAHKAFDAIIAETNVYRAKLDE